MKHSISHREHGLSLIELMVALLLSTLLILGITQLYVDNKRNYLFQQGQSDNLENARYALLLFEEELYRAGYRSRSDDDFENLFRAEISENCNFAAGEVIKYNADEQVICLRYQPGLPEITSCDGATLSGGSVPYAANVEPVITELQITDNTLLCNGTPLIDNLVDIQILFGTSPEGVRETEKFKAEPEASDLLRSIRYAVLLKSRGTNLADDNSSLAYTAWQEKWHDVAGATPPDRALYFSTENTLTLRNLAR